MQTLDSVDTILTLCNIGLAASHAEARKWIHNGCVEFNHAIVGSVMPQPKKGDIITVHKDKKFIWD